MSDLKNTVLGITKNITKSSSSIVKSTQLSIKLANSEENLKSIYMDIGKKVHEIYAYGGSLGEFFDIKYKEIKEAEAKISDVRNALDMAKGTKPCLKCGKSVARDATFCPTCGSEINGTEKNTMNIEESNNLDKSVDIEKSPVKICSICGDKNNVDEKFCLSCGRLL